MKSGIYRGMSFAEYCEIDAGYSPHNMAIMFTIEDVMVKVNGEDGEYRKLYNERKAYEIARDPEMSKMQAHRRAMKYMIKRLVLNLWKAWKKADGGQCARETQTPCAASA